METKSDVCRQTFVPHSHIPYGKDGTGSYSANNTSTIRVIDLCIPLVVDAIQSMDIKPGRVFTAVDYGAADGGASMQLWYACVKAIREKYGDELPINIIHEDQPVNDFKSVFMRTQGLIPGTHLYTHNFPNVFVLASGTNFYSQCLPDNSVNLGFSSTSMHWLSRKPCDLKETIFVHYLGTDTKEYEIFREQAEKDWERILLLRAAELAPGGRLIISLPAVDEDGHFTGGIALLSFHWKQMQQEGLITENEFQSTTFSMYCRTMDELKKPFESTDSAVTQAGLELISVEIRTTPNHFRERWLKENGSAKEHAKRVIASLREFTYSTFIGGLSDERSVMEKNDLVNKLFQRYEKDASKHPEDHGWDMIQCYVVIHKRS